MPEYQISRIPSRHSLSQDSKYEEIINTTQTINSNYLEEALSKLLTKGEMQVLKGMSIINGQSFDRSIVYMLRNEIRASYIYDSEANSDVRTALESKE